MKVAISASCKNVESLSDIRFGRCAYFHIFDLDTEKCTVVENNGSLANGGAGIVAAQQLVDSNINIVITGNIGPNAFEIIEKADIKVYRCNIDSIIVILNKFKENQLDEINLSGPGHNGI